MYTKERIELITDDDLWNILDPKGVAINMFPVNKEEAVVILEYLNQN